MQKLLDILYEIRPEVDFQTGLDFVDRGLLDSMDIIVLVTDIEAEFAISIDVYDIVPENFNSLAAMVGLIHRRGGQI